MSLSSIKRSLFLFDAFNFLPNKIITVVPVINLSIQNDTVKQKQACFNIVFRHGGGNSQGSNCYLFKKKASFFNLPCLAGVPFLGHPVYVL